MKVVEHRGMAGIFLASLLSTGCASPGWERAPHEWVKVRSTPPGATATASNGRSCQTPCKLRLPSRRGGTIDIALEGYETETVAIGSHVDGGKVALEALGYTSPTWAALAALTTAIRGPGLFKSLDRNRIDITLAPAGTPRAAEKDEPDLLVAEAASKATPVDPDAPGVVYRLSDEEIARLVPPR